MESVLEPLRIVIDTREQAPWGWDRDDAITEVHALTAGDYALADDCEPVKGRDSLAVRFAIERKSLEDFLATISTGWERFQRELVRMESFPARVIIVEGDFRECCFSQRGHDIIAPPHNHPGLQPVFVGRRISELTMMNVSVLFACDSQLAAGLAFRIFRRRIECRNSQSK
jgi:ERCC4-type nuclease